MLHPRAIEEFLEAERDTHAWIKELSEKQLDRELADLEFEPADPSRPLDKHQKACTLLGLAFLCFSFWLDMGCVDCETEYLSPSGWRRMDDYDDGLVAQYLPETGEAEFVRPKRHVIKPCDEMYKFHTRFGIDQKLSAEHKVLYADSRGHPKITSAEEIVQHSKGGNAGWLGRFYTTFKLKTESRIPLSDAELRVQVAVIADGNFWNRPTANPMRRSRPNASRMCSLRVVKKRKIIRMRQLLRAAKIEFEERREPTSPDYVNFVFVSPRRNRSFGGFYWAASAEQLAIVAEEVFHWDGSHNKNTKGCDSFYTTSKETADFVQYALVASGRTSSLNIQDRGGNSSRLYYIYARKTSALLEMRNKNKKSISKEKTIDGKKYCFEVPSGFLVFRRNGRVFMSGNTGKTRLVLELLRHFWFAGKWQRALILVPTEAAVDSWEKQIKLWNIEIPYLTLGNSPSAEKWQALDEFDEGFIIVTYPGLTWMLGKRVKPKGKKKVKLVPDPKAVKKLMTNLQAIIFDESTKLGNQGSLAYRLARKISSGCKIRYALAGRPFGREPTMLWSQQFLIDRGESLGPTLGLFRAAFFTEKKGYFGGYEYTFDKKMETDLAEIMQHRSISYASEECQTLPAVTRIVEKVTLPDDIEAYYEKAKQAIRAARGDFRMIKNIFLRMRQLSSGFIGFRDDETGEKAQIEFASNPKLDRLLDLIDGMPLDRKFVVFYEFTRSGRKISESLKQMKMPHGWLWSGTKNTKVMLQRFDDDPRYRGMIVNSKMGAMVLNFQVANYEFVFESPVSVIEREQMDKRLFRKGQKRKGFLYDLVARHTVDQKILDFHLEGEDIMRALLRDPYRLVA